MTLRSYIPGTTAWRERRDRELCMRTHDRLQEIIDGELTTDIAATLERHLEACVRCSAEADVIRDLKEAIARVGQNVDTAVVARLEALAQQLCDGGQVDERA